MEAGFIPDKSHWEILQSGWHPGPAERNWLFMIKYQKSQLVPITAYRCNNCGLLKLYAENKRD